LRPVWFLVALLGFPIAEIITIVAAADRFGAVPTIIALAVGVIAGVILLRVVGRAAIGEVNKVARSGFVRVNLFSGGTRLVIAGILLIIPGFLSDAIAVVLACLGAVDLIRRGRTVAVEPGPGGRRGEVIDLPPSDYRNVDRPPGAGG
jgi:UPF0716 protein FxsA